MLFVMNAAENPGSQKSGRRMKELPLRRFFLEKVVRVMTNVTVANRSHGSYPFQIRDLVIIMGLQRIIAYKIASYKTLLTFSRSMGHRQKPQVLTENIDGEKASAEVLMDIVVHGTIPLALKEPV
jgi:hypothetical protein